MVRKIGYYRCVVLPERFECQKASSRHNCTVRTGGYHLSKVSHRKVETRHDESIIFFKWWTSAYVECILPWCEFDGIITHSIDNAQRRCLGVSPFHKFEDWSKRPPDREFQTAPPVFCSAPLAYVVFEKLEHVNYKSLLLVTREMMKPV